MTQPADLVAASRAHGVRDPRLLEAIDAVPRAQFVPPDLAEHAYQDVPLPIPHGQVTTQPSLVTQVVLRKGDTLYLNDGIYGRFDELTLPGWTTDYHMRVFTLDSKGRAVTARPADTAFRIYGPTCDTLDVLPRPLMLPESILLTTVSRS